MSHEHLPSQTLENPDTNDPDYAPEKLEGINEAAASAVYVLSDAIKGNRHHGIAETSKGLRGIVEGSIPGGKVEGLFDGSTLEDINITLHGEDGEHVVRIEKPESGRPMIYLDDIPATAEDMPSVVGVIEQIKAEREAENQEEPVIEEADDEDEQAKKNSGDMVA